MAEDKLLRLVNAGLSGYGTSVGNPAAYLFSLWVFSTAAWVGYALHIPDFNTWDAIGFNLGRAFPFASLRGYHGEAFLNAVEQAPSALLALSGLLSIASPILLFLMGLGLRNKFRMS